MEYRKDRVQLLTDFEMLSRATQNAFEDCRQYVVQAWVNVCALALIVTFLKTSLNIHDVSINQTYNVKTILLLFIGCCRRIDQLPHL